MKVAILVPAYNNARTLPNLIGSIQNIAKKMFPEDNFYISVADDGSTDETNAALDICLKAVNSSKSNVRLNADSWSVNEGVGAITKKGLEIIAGSDKKIDFLIKIDGDGQHDPALLPAILVKLRGNADLVIASRFHRSSGQINTPLDRALLNRVFAGLIKEITGWEISDSRSGFMGMKWRHAKNMAPYLITRRYGIPMEIILRLWKMKPEARVEEVPHPALYGGQSLTEEHRRRYRDGGETIEQKSARVAEAYAAVLRVLEDMKVNAKQFMKPS